MSKFRDYKILNGGNSRVTKKSRSVTPMVDVLLKVSDQKTGHFLTNRKSALREPAGRIVARKLVPVETLFATIEEALMYREFCKIAGQ